MVDSFARSVMDLAGDTRPDEAVEFDRNITDALERNEDTFYNPYTGKMEDVRGPNNSRNPYAPTPNSLLANLNPSEVTINPLTTIVSNAVLNNPYSLIAGLLAPSIFKDPTGINVNLGPQSPWGYNMGVSLPGPIESVQVENLAPPAGLFDARLDQQIAQWALENELDQIDREGAIDGGGGSAGGSLSGNDDWSGAYDSDAEGYL